MSYIRSFMISMIALGGLSAGCSKRTDFDLQGNVDTLGDAMSHCRAYINHLMPSGTLVTLDEYSSRETSSHYDIFFELTDATQTGYAKCRVNKSGRIIYHAVRDFRTGGKSFTGF